MKCTNWINGRTCPCDEHTAFRKAVSDWFVDRDAPVTATKKKIDEFAQKPCPLAELERQYDREYRDSFTDEEWEHA